MSRHILFLAGLLSIFTFLSKISGVQSLEVQELNDGNINTLVGDGKDKIWLLMFYLETCPYCKVAKESFEKLSQRSDESLQNLNIGKLECSSNNWSCLRFNVTRVPYIALIKHDLLFELTSYVTEESLITFITGEKTLESGKAIPEQMGFVNIISTILKESVNILNEQIENFVEKNLKLNFKWKPSYTILVLIVVLVLVILVEYYVVYFCCSLGASKKKIENKSKEGESTKKGEHLHKNDETNTMEGESAEKTEQERQSDEAKKEEATVQDEQKDENKKEKNSKKKKK